MFSTLMIVSMDQGNLRPAPRRIGQFDARLLGDIGYEGTALPSAPRERGRIARHLRRFAEALVHLHLAVRGA